MDFLDNDKRFSFKLDGENAWDLDFRLRTEAEGNTLTSAYQFKNGIKVTNIAKKYYGDQCRDIDIIHLNGSIELAPILGLSDVIVDIVETGTTLRENGLKVVTEFMPISARFIANKASYQFKHAEMDIMLEKLRAELQNKEEAK